MSFKLRLEEIILCILEITSFRAGYNSTNFMARPLTLRFVRRDKVRIESDAGQTDLDALKQAVEQAGYQVARAELSRLTLPQDCREPALGLGLQRRRHSHRRRRPVAPDDRQFAVGDRQFPTAQEIPLERHPQNSLKPSRRNTMSTFTYKTLTALALTGALLAAPAFAEDAHHPEQLAQNQQDMPMGQGMGQGMGMMDMSKMQEMMDRMHNTTNPQERQKIRSEHRQALRSQMGMMNQRMQQSQCPMAKDAPMQQQCLRDMHQNMQNMMQMMEQMLESQSVPNGQ